MKSDPQKAREWQERGAKKYAERARTAASAPRKAKGRTKPRRNDSEWRAAVIALRGAYCRRCNGLTELQCDHVMPRGRGGPSVVENGTMLCMVCHQMRTEWKIRYRREWLDPDQIEWFAAVGWVRWDEDGQPTGTGCRYFEVAT